jgi:hypothetical protein
MNFIALKRQVRKETRLSFPPKGEIFLDPSHSLGMTGLSPLLGVLAPLRESSFFRFHKPHFSR